MATAVPLLIVAGLLVFLSWGFGVNGADLGGSVLTGTIAALIWAALVALRRDRQREENFDALAGLYRATEKGRDTPTRETVEIQVSGNFLEVTYHDFADGGPAKGVIQMSDEFPSSGRGHYDHIRPGPGGTERQLWGFWTVQVKDTDTILVHTTYTDAYREKVVGYVWSRIPEQAAS